MRDAILQPTARLASTAVAQEPEPPAVASAELAPTLKLSVVIAAYDEVANVETLVGRLCRALDGAPGLEWELLFVVEGRDGTREVLERLQRDEPRLRFLYRETPSGLGAAFRRGFAALPADTEWVVTLDADLNHQPEEIPRLLAAACARRCGVLVGSRWMPGSRVEGTPLWKRGLSTVVNLLMRRLYGPDVADLSSGFRVYRAEVLRQIRFELDGFAFLPELLQRARAAGWAIGEEPIYFTYRRDGISKMGFWPTGLGYLALLRSRFLHRS